MTKRLLTVRFAFVVAVLAVLLSVVAFGNARLLAQGEPGSIPELTLLSDNPGQLVISWEQPETSPSDYRIAWTPDGQAYAGWRDENQDDRGNAYPSGSVQSYTVNGLPGGTEYKVQMRARYTPVSMQTIRGAAPGRQVTPSGSREVLPSPQLASPVRTSPTTR